MKVKIILIFFIGLGFCQIWSQPIVLQSPNKKITVALQAMNESNKGEWYLKVSYQTYKYYYPRLK